MDLISFKDATVFVIKSLDNIVQLASRRYKVCSHAVRDVERAARSILWHRSDSKRGGGRTSCSLNEGAPLRGASSRAE